LALLRRAIRESWPVLAQRRSSIIDELADIALHDKPRRATAAFLALLEADRANRKAERTHG
jgi:hypothetical protein